MERKSEISTIMQQQMKPSSLVPAGAEQFQAKRSYLGAEDIPGAQAGSHRYGLASKRRTNPVDPVYQFPGMRAPLDLVAAQPAAARPVEERKAVADNGNEDYGERKAGRDTGMLRDLARFYNVTESYCIWK